MQDDKQEQDIQELQRLERSVNGKMGVSCVRSILFYLQHGDFESAQTVRRIEGDKTRQYPELESVLRRIFGCRIHGVHDCKDAWCEP